MDAGCEKLFSNANLIQNLRETKFDLAIVELLFNSCGVVFANYLGLPVVGRSVPFTG